MIFIFLREKKYFAQGVFRGETRKKSFFLGPICIPAEKAVKINLRREVDNENYEISEPLLLRRLAIDFLILVNMSLHKEIVS